MLCWSDLRKRDAGGKKCRKIRQNVRQLTDVQGNSFKISDHSAFVSSAYNKNLGGKAPVARSGEEIHAVSGSGRIPITPLYSGPLQRRLGAK